MTRLRANTPLWLRRGMTGIIGVTAMMVSFSIGNLSQAEVATTQTSVKAEPFNPAATEPADAYRMAPEFCQRDLDAAIASIVHDPRFRTAHWGILIEPIAEPTVLYQYNPDEFLIPASNIKLLTTAAALKVVGDRAPQYLAALENWITVINRDSDNGLADALLRRIGGQNIVRQALVVLGVNPASYQQVDGSGLSRSNRAQPSAFVTLLKGMYADSDSKLFYHSLPVAGVTGTLRNRFLNTPAEGQVRAKTGTLRGVRALSGYLENPTYGTIAFSIVINQPGQSGQVMTQAIDQIVKQTIQVNRCD